MIKVSTEGLTQRYDRFVDDCIVALFDKEPADTDYNISITLKKFVGDNGSHAGFCLGDEESSEIEVATHWIYEDDEVVPYTDFEIAGSIAHELTHAKQFARGQINMVNNVWKSNDSATDCDHLPYEEHPWEVEAYAYETILTDIYWR